MRKNPLISMLYGKIPNSIKFYPTFGSTLKEIKKTQYYSKQEIENYQFNKLYVLLKHCEKTVPWYKKSFNEAGSPTNRQPDMKKIKKIIKYNTNYKLENGLSETYDWYLDNIFKRNKKTFI